MASTDRQTDSGFDHVSETARPSEKEAEAAQTPKNGVSATEADNNSDQESLDHEAQAGVKAVQAAAAVWTKSQLVLAYVMSVSRLNESSVWSADISLIVSGSSTLLHRYRKLSSALSTHM